ncbi:hypothetical protein RIF29_33789 [Crotalaria pallida]|uniref:Uncharacterized protein n=1 Tax=Crotalaria pallida TaxID=3830 RepID=A0AAN9HU99_CROPI
MPSLGSMSHVPCFRLNVGFLVKTLEKLIVVSSEKRNYNYYCAVLVRWSSVMDRSLPDPPTAVFLHGILGCRKNWAECMLQPSCDPIFAA